ncbi:hypothetical protein [Methylocapsa sp. S129]|uniref:hypothetical protein n=1 Tax=Methylocapsa sp. S129 TaxID=1641869 RepID=UPI00131AB378|nr:hypothetical protein [Methylocapsa sp. S129]
MSGAMTALAAGAMILAASTAQAAMSPPPSEAYAASDVQLAAGGCGYGSHRLLFGGGCSRRAYNKEQRDYMRDLRPCGVGMHSESFPSSQGYRCVFNRRY